MKTCHSKGLVEVHFHNRDYTTNKQRSWTIISLVVVLVW